MSFFRAQVVGSKFRCKIRMELKLLNVEQNFNFIHLTLTQQYDHMLPFLLANPIPKNSIQRRNKQNLEQAKQFLFLIFSEPELPNRVRWCGISCLIYFRPSFERENFFHSPTPFSPKATSVVLIAFLFFLNLSYLLPCFFF